MKPERLREIEDINQKRAGDLWASGAIVELVAAVKQAQAELDEARETLSIYADPANWSSCLDTEAETGEYPNVNGFSDTRTIQIDAGIDIVWCNNDEGKMYAEKALKGYQLYPIDYLRKQLAEAQAVIKGYKDSKDCDVLRHQLDAARHKLRLSQEFGRNSAYSHLLALNMITEKQIEIDNLRKEIKRLKNEDRI